MIVVELSEAALNFSESSSVNVPSWSMVIIERSLDLARVSWFLTSGNKEETKVSGARAATWDAMARGGAARASSAAGIAWRGATEATSAAGVACPCPG